MGGVLHSETSRTVSFERSFFLFVFGRMPTLISVKKSLRRFLQAEEAYHHLEQTRRRA